LNVDCCHLVPLSQVAKASKYGLPVKTPTGEVVFQATRKQQLTAAKVHVEGIQVEDTLQSEKAQKAAEKEAAAAEAAERRAAAAAEKQAAAKAAAAAEAAAKKGEAICAVVPCVLLQWRRAAVGSGHLLIPQWQNSPGCRIWSASWITVCTSQPVASAKSSSTVKK
jgi:hypothetical protein